MVMAVTSGPRKWGQLWKSQADSTESGLDPIKIWVVSRKTLVEIPWKNHVFQRVQGVPSAQEKLQDGNMFSVFI